MKVRGKITGINRFTKIYMLSICVFFFTIDSSLKFCGEYAKRNEERKKKRTKSTFLNHRLDEQPFLTLWATFAYTVNNAFIYHSKSFPYACVLFHAWICNVICMFVLISRTCFKITSRMLN